MGYKIKSQILQNIKYVKGELLLPWPNPWSNEDLGKLLYSIPANQALKGLLSILLIYKGDDSTWKNVISFSTLRNYPFSEENLLK